MIADPKVRLEVKSSTTNAGMLPFAILRDLLSEDPSTWVVKEILELLRRNPDAAQMADQDDGSLPLHHVVALPGAPLEVSNPALLCSHLVFAMSHHVCLSSALIAMRLQFGFPSHLHLFHVTQH